jgi:hypothetical protein
VAQHIITLRLNGIFKQNKIKMKKVILLVVVFLLPLVLDSCTSQRSMVMEGGRYRKAKRWEVKHLQAQKGLRNSGRPCTQEW